MLSLRHTLEVRVPSVLIADDEPHLRLLVSASIASDEYVVIEAADGDEAWELIRQHRPAVAVLDVRMPGLNGVELTRKIRSHPELGGMRIILLTGSARERDIAAGREAGADLYLSKPFSPMELLEAVQRALQVA
jgi:CheY-like chemotaxis protein